MTDEDFTEAVLGWYEENGRSFYWRENELDSFDVLLTEVCLRRTTPESVENDIRTIIEELPSPEAVIGKGREELECILRPLGLQSRRADELYSMCQELLERYNGDIPESRNDLLEINGIGPYIADAVLCFAFGHDIVVADPNVARVASRYFGVTYNQGEIDIGKIKDELSSFVPVDRPREFNWALLDLGTYLKRQKPDESELPLSNHQER